MSATIEVRLRTIAGLAAAALVGIAVTLIVTGVWRADAAPGDEDATYVPIANCRLFDFRPGADNIGPKDTPLGPGESNVYTQQVTGTNGNCDIPDDAVGVAMNATIVGPTSQSNLRVFPADEPTPLASNLNWVAGQAPTPNMIDVKLSADGAINLFNQNGQVFVLADVVGFYTPESLKSLAAQVGQEGPTGPQGPRGFSAWDEIPSGTTVRGDHYDIGPSVEANDDGLRVTSIDLPGIPPVPLTNGDVNFAPDFRASDGDPACDGTAAAPTAPPGKVCIYFLSSSNVANSSASGIGSIFGPPQRAFIISWSAAAPAMEGSATGLYLSWAYTAP